jgi:hypothetical protein
MFRKCGLISEQFATTLLCWRHSGFSVDNSVRLDGGDHHARQALAQYIARAPLSLQKLTYDRPGGKVLYHTAFNPYFKQNTSLWSAPDFIAQLTWQRSMRSTSQAAAGCEADSESPLVCPRCGSEMKIIALITDPAQVGKILRHLLKIGRAPPGLDQAALN